MGGRDKPRDLFSCTLRLDRVPSESRPPPANNVTDRERVFFWYAANGRHSLAHYRFRCCCWPKFPTVKLIAGNMFVCFLCANLKLGFCFLNKLNPILELGGRPERENWSVWVLSALVLARTTSHPHPQDSFDCGGRLLLRFLLLLLLVFFFMYLGMYALTMDDD